LCANSAFGQLWHDAGAHLLPWRCGSAALGLGAVGGALNAALITRSPTASADRKRSAPILCSADSPKRSRAGRRLTRISPEFLVLGQERWAGLPWCRRGCFSQ
jgi:hypothetical protein